MTEKQKYGIFLIKSLKVITVSKVILKKTTKTTLYLPDNLHAKLKIQAAKLRTSMTKLIINAVEKELKNLADKDLDRN